MFFTFLLPLQKSSHVCGMGHLALTFPRKPVLEHEVQMLIRRLAMLPVPLQKATWNGLWLWYMFASFFGRQHVVVLCCHTVILMPKWTYHLWCICTRCVLAVTRCFLFRNYFASKSPPLGLKLGFHFLRVTLLVSFPLKVSHWIDVYELMDLQRQRYDRNRGRSLVSRSKFTSPVWAV